MRTIALTLFLLVPFAARASHGFETHVRATDVRRTLGPSDRVSVLKAIVLGPTHAAPGLLRVTPGPDDTEVQVVAGHLDWLRWTIESDGKAEVSGNVARALTFAILFAQGKRIDDYRWDGKITPELETAWGEIDAALTGDLARTVFPSEVVTALREHYVMTGDPVALTWFARGLRALVRGYRGNLLVGTEQWLLMTDLPELAFRANHKTRVMDALLVMTAVAVESGLDGSLTRSGPAGFREAMVIERASVLAPLLRQILATPEFVAAGLRPASEEPLRRLFLGLERPAQTFLAVDSGWGAPASVADFYVALAREVRSAIVSSGYLPGVSGDCARALGL